MKKTLILVAGCAMILFAVLHGYLAWYIHGLTTLSPYLRALMEMLNIATGLFILFLGVSSLFFLHDLVATRLGNVVLLSGFLLMIGRAVGEIVIFPGFNTPIFVVCGLVACLYGAALLWRPSSGVSGGQRQEGGVRASG